MRGRKSNLEKKLDRVIALLERIAYQTSGTRFELGDYLSQVVYQEGVIHASGQQKSSNRG